MKNRNIFLIIAATFLIIISPYLILTRVGQYLSDIEDKREALFENELKLKKDSIISASKIAMEEIENAAKKGKKQNYILVDSLKLLHFYQERTVDFIDKIDLMLRRIPNVSDSVTGRILRKDEIELNRVFFFGENEYDCGAKNCIAFQIKQKINEFYIWTYETYNAGKPENEKWSVNNKTLPNEKDGKCWEKYTFEGPLIANLAMIQALKMDIYHREWLILQDYRQRVGINSEASKIIIPSFF